MGEEEGLQDMFSMGCRTLSRAVDNLIPYTFRVHMHLTKQRCASQSSCAERARELVKIIYQDLESCQKINDLEKSTENQWDKICYYDKQIPLISKNCREAIFKLLDECSDSLDSKDDHYLTRHNCNALALMTINEASVQAKAAVMSPENQGNLTKVLDGLHFTLSNSSKFSCTVDIPCVAEKLELKKLQYKGDGIEYLKLLSKQKRDKESNNNSLWSDSLFH